MNYKINKKHITALLAAMAAVSSSYALTTVNDSVNVTGTVLVNDTVTIQPVAVAPVTNSTPGGVGIDPTLGENNGTSTQVFTQVGTTNTVTTSVAGGGITLSTNGDATLAASQGTQTTYNYVRGVEVQIYNADQGPLAGTVVPGSQKDVGGYVDADGKFVKIADLVGGEIPLATLEGLTGDAAAAVVSSIQLPSTGGNLTVQGTTTTNGLANTGALSTGTLSTTGAATLDSASITNNATVGGTLNVSGNTTTAGIANTGALTNNGTLTINGASSLNGTLNVSGNTTTAGITNTGALTNNGTLTINGAASLNSTLNVGGIATTAGIINNGALTNNGTITVTNGNVTIGGLNYTSTGIEGLIRKVDAGAAGSTQGTYNETHIGGASLVTYSDTVAQQQVITSTEANGIRVDGPLQITGATSFTSRPTVGAVSDYTVPGSVAVDAPTTIVPTMSQVDGYDATQNTLSANEVVVAADLYSEAAARASADNQLQANLNEAVIQVDQTIGDMDVLLDSPVGRYSVAQRADLVSAINAVDSRVASVENRTSALEGRVGKAERDIRSLRKGVAMAAALQTPVIDQGDKQAIKVGAATYDGEQGLGLGYAVRVGDSVTVNVDVATGFPETVARGGVNLSF